MIRYFLITFFCLISLNIISQEVVTVDINSGSETKSISPYLFGKNNSLSDDASNPLNASEWQYLCDLGINMFRESGGNNSTKYNWKRKLTSHPDWYNNVFHHNWGFAAGSLQEKIPSAQGMWSFQLIGKAAKSNSDNFSSWDYNQAQWWEGVHQNLCGGGVPNDAGGSVALVEGDPDLYLEDWNADSTTEILNHWFGTNGLGLNPSKSLYWSMDNEPEIWTGTHDDVMPTQPTAEEFMQIYFEVAKKARAKYPDIKLLGPVPANEWQWYNWDGSKISYNSEEYVWLEYFILRIAEEQAASGIRLLDVLDIHFYPGETNNADIIQLHRVYFDTSYIYPGANGVKRSGNVSWDNSINKEYIFTRCENWLSEYLGADHGVSLSVTETGINSDDPNIVASWYASTIGEFAKNGVEIFTPWSWKTGMNEVVHLFSNYSKENYIEGISSDEEFVSAHPTQNDDLDSLTVFLINRHLTDNKEIKLTLNNFNVADGSYELLRLSELPQNETFFSHAVNALTLSEVFISNNIIETTLPPLSISVVILKASGNNLPDYGPVVAEVEAENGILTGVIIDNTIPGYSGDGYVTGFDNSTDILKVTINIPEQDFYKIVIRYNGPSGDKIQDFRVNGGFYSQVNFPACDTFTVTEAGAYELQAGENTLEIRKNWGWTNIDKFIVYNSEDNQYNISPVLVDNEATAETKALYDFLLLQFGKRIISGQTHDYFDDLASMAGKTPLLRVGDFQHFTEGYPYLWVDGGHTFGKHDDGSVDELINWYNSTGKKALISYQWHWHSPTGGDAGTNTFYTDLTTFDITKAVTPGTEEYDLIIRDIDDIAVELKRFQNAGIPILWRPLHEAGGGWFWWGAKGPEACVEMYNIIFDRLKNYHQLHNLIWVWSTPEQSWYPGNDKVDIIGHDSYPGNYNYGTQKNAFDELFQLTNGEKLIAMTENGPIPDINDCLTYDAPWSYFMSWSDLVTEQNSLEHIIDVYNHPNVLTIESDNSVTGKEWRSTLYPDDWNPGFEDSQGRFLHDFSYAGYHKGEKEIPLIDTNIVDITKAPYNADNTGTDDVTAILQQAINDIGTLGGGVIYLPAGIYRIITPGNSDNALRISKNNTVIRGAGPDSTFILNDQDYMRHKDVIRIMGSYSNWFNPEGSISNITTDLLKPTRVIPVESVDGFNSGDNIIISNYPTPEFCAEHNMEEYWTQSAIKGVAFKRVIDSIDIEKKLLIIDAPTRYWLKTRDRSRVYHAGQHISECGIENLSIGNIQNTKSGWGEEDYTIDGTGAYDVHFSHVLKFEYADNCWVKNVSSYKPTGNTNDIHLLSNFLLLNMCRNITVDSCNLQKPQYEGGGGNGYMYTLQSNDCLISNSIANDSRHNYDFKYPYSNGNVIHNCRGENSKYSSDFHMYLSMSNLFDAFKVKGDYLESVFRPYGGDAIHGYSSTQSVFYNTYGEAYHSGRDFIIDSRQFGWGYIIGTSGPADNVVRDPVIGSTNGFPYDTSPRDFLEGQSTGEDLRPVSLYLDQLDKRLNRTNTIRKFNVNIKVLDEDTGEPLFESTVKIYNDEQITNYEGIASFSYVYEVFVISVEKDKYYPIEPKQFSIYSDTSITISMKLMDFQVRLKLFDKLTNNVFSGANVTFNSINKVTDELGEVSYNVPGGIYDYSIDKLNYHQVTGSVEIISDTLFEFFLEREFATIKFKLKDGTAPVNNALVILNNDSLISNNLGMSTFLNFSVPENYFYSISKSGYFINEGSLYLVTDTSLNIVMESFPDDILIFEDNGKIRLWPNPVNDVLHFSYEGNNSSMYIEIIDLTGKKMDIEFINNENINLNVKNYPSGIYIIKTQSNEYVEKLMFIKN